MLAKIVNTLCHHSTIQNEILSTFNEELKIRPTYSEIIGFVAKRSEPKVVDKNYVDLDILENVTSELDRKFEITSAINRDQVDKAQNFQRYNYGKIKENSSKVGKHA